MVDAPGYGYAKGDAKELESWGKMITKYIDASPYLHRVICLIDAEHGIKQLDEHLFEMLDVKKKMFMICLTKCDKIPMKLLSKNLEDIKIT